MNKAFTSSVVSLRSKRRFRTSFKCALFIPWTGHSSSLYATTFRSSARRIRPNILSRMTCMMVSTFQFSVFRWWANFCLDFFRAWYVTFCLTWASFFIVAFFFARCSLYNNAVAVFIRFWCPIVAMMDVDPAQYKYCKPNNHNHNKSTQLQSISCRVWFKHTNVPLIKTLNVYTQIRRCIMQLDNLIIGESTYKWKVVFLFFLSFVLILFLYVNIKWEISDFFNE